MIGYFVLSFISMNLFISYIFRLEDFICKHRHLVRFYFTKKGLKNFGAYRLLGAKHINPLETIELSPAELFLGPDFLKDDYTLLGINIVNSPHFSFMRALMERQPIIKTDYIQRSFDGTLDWRRGSLKTKRFDMYNNKFIETKDVIISGKMQPVVVYKNGEHYYIYDGKHRAALCSLLELPVMCSIVGNEIAHADLWHYMFSLIKDKACYSKHTQFHNLYLGRSK